jgi:hypothetical protein
MNDTTAENISDAAEVLRELAAVTGERARLRARLAEAEEILDGLLGRLACTEPELGERLSRHVVRVRLDAAGPLPMAHYAKRLGVSDKLVAKARDVGWLKPPAFDPRTNLFDIRKADAMLASLEIQPAPAIVLAARRIVLDGEPRPVHEVPSPPIALEDDPVPVPAVEIAAAPEPAPAPLPEPTPEPVAPWEDPPAPEPEPAPPSEPATPEPTGTVELPPGSWDAPMDHPEQEQTAAEVAVARDVALVDIDLERAIEVLRSFGVKVTRDAGHGGFKMLGRPAEEAAIIARARRELVVERKRGWAQQNKAKRGNGAGGVHA